MVWSVLGYTLNVQYIVPLALKSLLDSSLHFR